METKENTDAGKPIGNTNGPIQQGQRELTFGEKAVGITFNPGMNEDVNNIKRDFAIAIDRLNNMRNFAHSGEVKRQLSEAITAAQTAQMCGLLKL